MVGNAWLFSYDSSNLVEIQQPSDESPNPEIHTTYGYDANHKMTSQIDFEGFEYEITYHSSGYQANKVATFVEPTENAATSEFTYQEDQDGYDKKTTLTDGEDRNTYYYFSDTTQHLMKISMVNSTTVLKTEYEYNALGLVSTISDSYDKETTLTYDTVGHVETITYPPPTIQRHFLSYSNLRILPKTAFLANSWKPKKKSLPASGRPPLLPIRASMPPFPPP